MWQIIDENDYILETGLTQEKAEDLLCKYLNAGVEAWLQEIGE